MAGVYNIPSGYSFLESLSIGLLKRGEKDPFGLSQMEVFLPTRRACIEVQRAMLRQGKGQCFLLPKLTPLGDLDGNEVLLTSFSEECDLRPLLPSFNRLSLLTSLIEEYTEKSGLPSTPALSLKLAKSLVSLMDQAAIENVPWEGLLHLVPQEFASHWQLTLSFLNIITAHWPKILEEKRLMEPYPRHHAIVDRILARWEKYPPPHPMIAAGSTGTMPATFRLLQAVARLPQGMVILPGLDTSLEEEEAKDLSSCHPQYAPTRFLQKMNLKPSEIVPWAGLAEQSPGCVDRAHLFSSALKPSFSGASSVPPKALEGIYRILCDSPQEEALAIAILLRQQLEVPHQRAALITSDLKLAERVREELKRWNIEIDSSAGEPLNQTPSGVFFSLCGEFVENPHDQVALLSLLKHPLCHVAKRHEIRQFEKSVLRKASLISAPFSYSSFDFGAAHLRSGRTEEGSFFDAVRPERRPHWGRSRRIEGHSRDDETKQWLSTLQGLIRPFTELKKVSFEQILSMHISLAETLSMEPACVIKYCCPKILGFANGGNRPGYWGASCNPCCN